MRGQESFIRASELIYSSQFAKAPERDGFYCVTGYLLQPSATAPAQFPEYRYAQNQRNQVLRDMVQLVRGMHLQSAAHGWHIELKAVIDTPTLFHAEGWQQRRSQYPERILAATVVFNAFGNQELLFLNGQHFTPEMVKKIEQMDSENPPKFPRRTPYRVRGM